MVVGNKFVEREAQLDSLTKFKDDETPPRD